MSAEISEPKIIEHGPYCVVGMYAIFQGDREDPAWTEAYTAFMRRKPEVRNRVGDTMLGFLYRPHKDDPAIAAEVRSCFVGVEATDLSHVPAGMAATRFSGGQYVTVTCTGRTQDESAMGVGDAVALLEKWIRDNGYREGDACFALGHEGAATPPFVEHVHIKLERPA